MTTPNTVVAVEDNFVPEFLEKIFLQAAFIFLVAASVGVVAKKAAASVRGRYKTWDEHCMQCALAELEEASDPKNADKKFNALVSGIVAEAFAAAAKASR